VNGAVDPLVELPASGDCRLRIINGDPTRIMRLAIEGAEAGVLAIDGFAVPPAPFEGWTLAPAMRIDLVLRAPEAGKTAFLIDEAAGGRVVLAHFTGKGEPVRAESFDPAPLHAARVPDPDLASATRMTFAFDRTDDGKAIAQAMDYLPESIGALCLSTNAFWSVGGQVWPGGDHTNLPAPIARLELGKSYVFTLKNLSPFAHPIHIHGHTFRLLESSHLKRPEHHTDTLLLMPEEAAEVAFVADNPGKWMFHCHIIEHQEAGMMVYLEVA
ncbi:MAG: multicopper oxidase domain-containing protein, partial [Beijerinckiaceae bacterium]|nr:multicopper oxidase domain-containing protein [Beijerinckiaceae bacterium]